MFDGKYYFNGCFTVLLMVAGGKIWSFIWFFMKNVVLMVVLQCCWLLVEN